MGGVIVWWGAQHDEQVRGLLRKHGRQVKKEGGQKGGAYAASPNLPEGKGGYGESSLLQQSPGYRELVHPWIRIGGEKESRIRFVQLGGGGKARQGVYDVYFLKKHGVVDKDKKRGQIKTEKERLDHRPPETIGFAALCWGDENEEKTFGAYRFKPMRLRRGGGGMRESEPVPRPGNTGKQSGSYAHGEGVSIERTRVPRANPSKTKALESDKKGKDIPSVRDRR